MEEQQLTSDPMDFEWSSATKAGADDYSDIRLRLLTLSDAGDCTEWLSDEKAAKFCFYDCLTSKEDVMNYVANVLIPHPWHRAICLKDKPVGSITVTPFAGDQYRCRAEIGYVLGPKYWGKGIATKAVKMVTYSVFREWANLDRLEAIVDVENFGSQRVLEKAGFCREGVLRKYCVLKGRIPRDMVMFSILSTDPQVQYFMFN
ncbi:OLC1v1020007C1 [Oldenlandia corymbosa var. corymbosa]|uniref:OLC1v1020007C1 n=1 Tax=Oldenlandia corymbosa var. corymbosa TaxID=529605 RepID=A0AAV1EFG8_OLDCO|nr:OLC1v1020007C1 [Oldenlandia corymbosa var. corymbosa]